jgi:hypothetical protein
MQGVVPNFRFYVSVVASQNNLISILWKWKKHFSWDKTKIRLRGVPCHPMCHVRILYGLIPTNYALIKAEHSPFDLKIMQPQTW